MKNLSRRNFLKLSAMGIGAAVVSSGLAGCNGSSKNSRVAVSFAHGVASGDPLQDKVIIWTRVTPEESADITVGWEVATDAAFADLVHTGETTTTAAKDYTVKVDVQNLTAGTRYYYRFVANGTYSATGQMKTLPQGAVEQIKMAVFSCSNYPAGFFNVYAEAAKQKNLDVVLHLGDYIYEYAMGEYATENAESIGRALPQDNNTELFTLEDYRKRYALYRTDTDLQAIHAQVAFIPVWDDHEVANDTWRDGAENHSDNEGDFTQRKLAALQAYFEWLPIRPANPDDEKTIYRQFTFGDLLDLYMLDTRIIGRDLQLDYADYMDAATGAMNAAQFMADLSDTNRTLLGAEQKLWLQQSMMTSTATWQVLGQQVLMGRMNVPAELLKNPAAMAELVAIKMRMDAGDPSLTEAEKLRITTAVPYNLDAWDGYAYERETLFGLARQLDKNLVVLAGDTHNAWANNLQDMSGNAVGVEFAVSSVTSPGLETYLKLGNNPQTIARTEYAFTTLIDGLEYLNVNQRGFMTVTFTHDRADAKWTFVDTILSNAYNVDQQRTKALGVLPGSANRQLVS